MIGYIAAEKCTEFSREGMKRRKSVILYHGCNRTVHWTHRDILTLDIYVVQ